MSNPLPSNQPGDKPDIVPIAEQYTTLKRAGGQWRGLCPIHSEKTPSFTVNPEKQVFYCHGCHQGGDVIRFVELAEGTDFKGAVKILGIEGGEYKPKPKDPRKQRAAAILADWLNQQHLKIGAMLRELSGNIAIAEEVSATTLVERFEREFSILEILFDDLSGPESRQSFGRGEDSVERITARAPVEPLPAFPPWTAEYAAYLAAHLPAPEAVA